MINDFFKLIRIKNLAIIALTMYLMRWCVAFPFLRSINLELQYPEFNFFLLVIATVFIAGAGYAINDYFDRKVDLMNHPDTVVVGTKLPRRFAMTINNLFNFLGVGIGFCLSWQADMFNVGFIFLIISGALWFYSSLYKKQLLIGNLIVATFTAIVPLLVAIFEVPAVSKLITPEHPPLEKTVISVLFLYIVGYSFFAFITTLAREIIKDIEDMEGDGANGRRTVPVKLGVKTAKSFVIGLLCVILACLSIVYVKYFQDMVSLTYLVVFVVLPLFYVIYLVYKAKSNGDYRKAGNMLKGIMLTGLLYSVVLYFII